MRGTCPSEHACRYWRCAVNEAACEKILAVSQEKVVSSVHGVALCASAIFIC